MTYQVDKASDKFVVRVLPPESVLDDSGLVRSPDVEAYRLRSIASFWKCK